MCCGANTPENEIQNCILACMYISYSINSCNSKDHNISILQQLKTTTTASKSLYFQNLDLEVVERTYSSFSFQSLYFSASLLLQQLHVLLSFVLVLIHLCLDQYMVGRRAFHCFLLLLLLLQVLFLLSYNYLTLSRVDVPVSIVL